MAKEDTVDLDQLKNRLAILDERLDNVDSMLTAVAERVMKQPISIQLTCPHCGRNIEIALVGHAKYTG